ncbi:type II secretion system F family protein [Cohnella soli]|uniref:Type II secretion system F family protein n=1 Tax=Cohnella soli TaxID=425005 RepID=A0ABW0HS23_9BACL
MIYAIFALCAVFVILFYQSIRVYRKEKIQAVMEKLVPQSVEENGAKGIRQWINIGDKQTRQTVIIIACAFAAGLMSLVVGGNFIIMGLAGGSIPLIIIKQKQFMFEKQYRSDAQAAIQFLQGIISAGGTLEDWMLEVQPRLSGPLKKEFAHGYENYKRHGVSITKFLESLIKNCPDSGLKLVFAGILREANGSNNLNALLEGTLRDMQNQARFTRVLGQVRKSGSQMLMYIYVFPVFFYFLFSDSVDSTIERHPVAMIVLLVGIAGYSLLGWWGYRVTRTKL